MSRISVKGASEMRPGQAKWDIMIWCHDETTDILTGIWQLNVSQPSVPIRFVQFHKNATHVWQIAALSPEVIANVPYYDFNYITWNQLYRLSSAQVIYMIMKFIDTIK